jgi:hypothetical protein
MEKIEEIKQDIICQLYDSHTSDLSDIGNEIGIVIGKYTDDENTIEDFISGLRHGVSLANGTHP